MENVAHNTIREPIERAIALKGTEQKLAEACGVSQPAIWKAKTTGRISAELAKGIHRATDGAVPASELRPDLWRRPEDVPVEAVRGTETEKSEVA